MTTHISTANRTTQWNITADNDTWIVGQAASFHITNGNGIAENGHTNSTIRILGDMEIKGTGYAGARVDGSASSILVGAQSEITGKQGAYGLWSEAAGADITNHGKIVSNSTGILGNIWGDVVNDGTIKAPDAITFQGDGSQIHNSGLIDGTGRGLMLGASETLIVNEKGGEISGGMAGILLTGDGDTVIANKGILRSDNTALDTMGTGAQTFANTGKIFGDVYLNAGEDVFDTRYGTIQGKVFGGDDSDTYKIASSNVKIGEALNGGAHDRVFSTASYVLNGEIEELHLKGGKDIDGTGSGTANALYGNSGDNTLFGRGGADWLDGGKGNDILIGGAGSDTFVFEKGYGKDIVRDFVDGVDHFHSSEVTSQMQFDNLNISQVGENTVINFGDGDRLVIEDTLKSNIDYLDFV